MAGYSGTPLIKKLGIKEGFRVAFVAAPQGFDKDLGPLPANVRVLERPRRPMDFVLLFTKSAATLERDFARIANMLSPTGMLWISWPKKSSGVASDLSDNNVRQIGLSAGLVDVKVCAVNDIWSGLKFVYRLQDRKRIRS
jgi:hypothetical protein